MAIGIYKILNTNNNKIYIGSAVNLERRKKSHFSKLKRNKHHNKHLQSSYNLDNPFEFIILEEVYDKSNLIEREQYYIDNLVPEYNIRKIAESNLGLKLSMETKEKISKSNKGKKRSLETKEKYRLAKLGTSNPTYGKPAHNRGKEISMEQKIKCMFGNAKLTTQNVLEIKELLRLGLTQRLIGKIFNVSHSTIGKINTNRVGI